MPSTSSSRNGWLPSALHGRQQLHDLLVLARAAVRLQGTTRAP